MKCASLKNHLQKLTVKEELESVSVDIRKRNAEDLCNRLDEAAEPAGDQVHGHPALVQRLH